MQKIMWSGAIAGIAMLALSSVALAQTATVDANTRANLDGALNALDGTLDVTATREAQGTIPNETVVENTLDGIRSTLLNIQAGLAADGTAGGGANNSGTVIPSQFPNTGDHPDM
jgi:hypothetical protein